MKTAETEPLERRRARILYVESRMASVSGWHLSQMPGRMEATRDMAKDQEGFYQTQRGLDPTAVSVPAAIARAIAHLQGLLAWDYDTSNPQETR